METTDLSNVYPTIRKSKGRTYSEYIMPVHTAKDNLEENDPGESTKDTFTKSTFKSKTSDDHPTIRNNKDNDQDKVTKKKSKDSAAITGPLASAGGENILCVATKLLNMRNKRING